MNRQPARRPATQDQEKGERNMKSMERLGIACALAALVWDAQA